MSREDLITVVVPVWNAGDFLGEALESLRSQSHDLFEAILVNDGSTDNSEEICRRFCETDNRFHLINQANSGVSAARNAGIDIARGKWIAFMDADDIMPSDSLEVLLESAAKYDVSIVVGGYCRELPDKPLPKKVPGLVLSAEKAVEIGLYQKKILNNPWGVLFNSSVFGHGADKLRFRNCRYEDLDLFYQAFLRVDKVCVIDRPVYCYRDNPGSFINRWSPARLDVLDVTDRIVVAMSLKGPELLRAAEDRRFSAHYNILLMMEKNGIDLPEQKERCWRIIRKQRLNELTNPNVRLKNKLGALASYLGRPAIKLMSKL
jgi:glycosyltransferase involved in cell wall biosynthesis